MGFRFYLKSDPLVFYSGGSSWRFRQCPNVHFLCDRAHRGQSKPKVACKVIGKVVCEVVCKVVCEVVCKVVLKVVFKVVCKVVLKVVFKVVLKVVFKVAYKVVCEVAYEVVCEVVCNNATFIAASSFLLMLNHEESTKPQLPAGRLMDFWDGYGGEISEADAICPLPRTSVSTVSLTCRRRERRRADLLNLFVPTIQ